jgi:hypothetical protein
MPRARTTPATDDETVIKKPRATRTRTVSSDDVEKPAPRRRRTVEAVPEPVIHHSPAHDHTRKAPTALGDRHRKQTRNSRGLLFVSTFCAILIACSLGVGILDHGVIDVVAVVNERNEKINRGEVRDANGQAVTQTVSVQSPETRPNGGLILADVQPATNPTPTDSVLATESASSSATSTLPVSDAATTTATTTVN